MPPTGDPDAGESSAAGDGNGLKRAWGDRLALVVVAVTVLSLSVRLVGLGDRPFHWDEGRVGYWTLRYLSTGVFEYRPVSGGPFLPLVNRHVFALLGVSDATARLVVALVGGLLPLSALLFRHRLRWTETAALAVVLGFNPLLLYYSRFLRGDVLLAAFVFVAVGFAVRVLDTRDARFVYAATAAFALSLTTSGFVVGTVFCLLVASALTLYLVGVRGTSFSAEDAVVHLRRSDGWSTTVARAFLLFFGVLIYFYAPRAGGSDAPGLWNLSTFPTVLDEALFGSVRKFYGVWIASRASQNVGHELVSYLSGTVDALLVGALVVVGFALLGVVIDRYGPGGPRPLVALFTYWGGVSLLVFSIVTETLAPWLAVHVVVPLAVPAAVGAAWVIGLARRSVERDDAVSVGVTVLVLLAVGTQVAAVAAEEVYAPSGPETRLAQYSQPSSDLEPLVEEVRV
ncbi:MAG: flippase activity-associated protein Agl23, partial [Halobacteriota archaeon]